VTRAVVDLSVLVSAFLGNPEAGPGQMVAAWRDDRFVPVVSPLLLAELGEVLARPKFARWADDGRAEAYVGAFAAHSEHHPDSDDAAGSVRDPDDDYLIALARTSNADALVSLDRDLLDAPIGKLLILEPFRFHEELRERGR
jgi:putative PIN family toxin of toxin-antitoxin system